MSNNDNYDPIVLDNGSGITKAGFGGEDFPRIVLPTIIGTPKYHPVMLGLGAKKYYIGEEAQCNRGILSIRYPIEHGIIEDWNFIEMLRVKPSNHYILLTEPPMNPKKNKEKIAEIMFEKFNVPGCFVATQAILALYSAGRTTGVILDSGDGVSNIIPICDGYTMNHASIRLNLAGRDLTNYLIQLCLEKGIALNTSSERDIARDVKEKLCYVSLDYEQEIKKFQDATNVEQKYELPDGQIINLCNQRFRCPEALFNPQLIGKEIEGLHTSIYNSISKCSLDMRRELYTNIVLSGGTTLFPGICERLHKEINKLVNSKIRIHIVAPLERKYSVWIGGSILSSLASFREIWIKRHDYLEKGNSILHIRSI